MRYDFLCQSCGHESEEAFAMSEVPKSIPCDCGDELTQSFANVGNFCFPKAGNWTEGKFISQLHPRDPLRNVTSKNEMRRNYDECGISMDTAEITNQSRFDQRYNSFLPEQGKPDRYIPEDSRKDVSGPKE